jgi:hypothetical protein
MGDEEEKMSKKLVQDSVTSSDTLEKLVGEIKLDSNHQSIEKNHLLDLVSQSESHVSTIRKWLNKSMRVKITDGRVLVGVFLCTDKHSNIILGSCLEYIDSQGLFL